MGQVIGRKLSTRQRESLRAKEHSLRLKRHAKAQKRYYKNKKKRLKYLKLAKIYEKISQIRDRPHIPYVTALEVYGHIVEVLDAMGYSMVVPTGAMRRKLKEIASIPLIIMDEDNQEGIDHIEFMSLLAHRGYLCNAIPPRFVPSKYSGARNAFILEGINVIIYMCHPNKIGPMLLYTTGNALFLKRLATYAMQSSRLLIRKTGIWQGSELLCDGTEHEIFEYLGIEYVSPEDRSFSMRSAFKEI